MIRRPAESERWAACLAAKWHVASPMRELAAHCGDRRYESGGLDGAASFLEPARTPYRSVGESW